MATTRTLDDPDLLPFLPFIYLAWSDGELAETEITSICAELSDTGVTQDCQTAFLGWLDPDDPPSPNELSGVLEAIRARSGDIDGAEALDIESFAATLATTGRGEADLTAAELDAIRMLGEQLGLSGSEPTRAVLGHTAPASTSTTAATSSAALNVASLIALRDGPRHGIKQRLRSLLAEPDFAHVPGLHMDDYRARVLAQLQRLADEGYGRLGFPHEHGGTGSQSDFVGAFSVLAHHDLSLLTKYGVQFGLYGGAILRLGTQSHHEELLEPMMTMAMPGCFAMTETDHGSNVQKLETTATYDPATEEFVVNTPHRGAGKDYIGNAAKDGRTAVVFAQLHAEGRGHGVHALVVPIRSEDGEPLNGVTIEDDGPKAGLNGVDNGRLWFDNVRVPRTALLDKFASVRPDGTYDSPIPGIGKRFFTTIATLVGGRIGVGTGAISASETALAIAIRYGLRRRQFGPENQPETTLLDYPQHQRRLMPLLATTWAYRFAFEHLIDDYAEERIDPRLIEGHAAGLKAFSTWHANTTIHECREACGGAGFMARNRLGPLRADIDIFQTYEGDNTVLAQLVARGLLSNYAQQFNDLGLLGTARFFAGRAVGTVRDVNPIVVGGASKDSLRDPARYLDLLHWREERLVATLGARLRHRIGDGMDSAVAFAEVQNHAIRAARAHVEHLVTDRFLSVVASMDPGAERDALQELCDLHALSMLEADLGWFMEHGKLSAAAAKQLRTVIGGLCADVRANARPLVDAFAIPDAVLGAEELL